MRAARSALVIVLWSLAPGLPAAARAQGLRQELRVPEGAVAFGTRFTVEVRRVRPAGAVLAPFDETALAPLRVVERERREERTADGVLERIRLRGHLFRSGAVTLTLPALPGRDGAGATLPEAPPCTATVTVSSSLPADDALEVELPREPFPATPAARWWPLLLPLVALALAAGLVVARRRRRHGAGGGEAATPGARALRALRGLAEAGGPEGHGALARILREWAGATYELRGPSASTEELARAVGEAPGIPERVRVGLPSLLQACDRARFAPGDAGSGEALPIEEAMALVRAVDDAAREDTP